VELNRRLAPAVYLGVLPIVLDPEGRHRLGGAGSREAAVEWAVHMVRLPAERRGDRRLERGLLSAAQLEALAGRLSDFHAAGRHDDWAAAFGTPEAVLRNVEDNLAQGRAIQERVLSPEEAARLGAAQTGFVRAHAALFAERARQGRVRDGHGDLRLSQMYFAARGDDARSGDARSGTGQDGEGSAGVAILDCIEFADRYRFADVAADVGFLAMDLALHGRDDLAEIFLAAYARASGDFDLYRLVDFYAAYRACIRGKVSGYAALDPEAPPAVRAAAEAKAAACFRFALERLRRLESRPHAGLAAPIAPAAPPAPLIAFGGGIGTGKSTLASALGRRLPAPVLDSDRIRKQMAGLDPLAPCPDALWSGLYSPERSEGVYAELRRRALAVLESGRPAIVDASFRSRAQREAMREAARGSGHPFHFIACRADGEVVRERLAQRAEGPSVSDGRQAIAEAFQLSFEPDEGHPGDTLEIDTARPIEDCLSTIQQAIGGTGS
jgi:aminoglycoside phosphotransferase family enzyme/predicted kinase